MAGHGCGRGRVELLPWGPPHVISSSRSTEMPEHHFRSLKSHLQGRGAERQPGPCCPSHDPTKLGTVPVLPAGSVPVPVPPPPAQEPSASPPVRSCSPLHPSGLVPARWSSSCNPVPTRCPTQRSSTVPPGCSPGAAPVPVPTPHPSVPIFVVSPWCGSCPSRASRSGVSAACLLLAISFPSNPETHLLFFTDAGMVTHSQLGTE